MIKERSDQAPPIWWAGQKVMKCIRRIQILRVLEKFDLMQIVYCALDYRRRRKIYYSRKGRNYDVKSLKGLLRW